ncbi:MAG: amidohydrolase family protein, partial [Prevotella sp.]|nr:amidohydrolase family protein [Prevotella sp.]
HPEIRDRKCCMESSSRAVRLARKHGTQLHIAHVSTADELTLVDTPSQDDNDGMCRNESNITLEAVIGHLFFDDQDYKRLGTKIKVNPAIKSHDDRMALLKALAEGRISVVATDHAPHLLEQKEGGCARAASGMPIIQFSLPLMLSLTDEGVIDICRVVQLMSHNPARIFGLRQRGFLRKGYKADITIVRRQEWTLDESMILSKCKWSPLTGHQFSWMVTHTLCNGHLVYDQGRIDRTYVGEPLVFR